MDEKPAPPVIYPVQPFNIDNCVGLGVFLGFIYHGITSWDKLFPPGKFEMKNMINFCLMTIHIGTFSLILGNLLYQLIFWVFRCYNRKLIKRPLYKVAIERCIQFIFGLCLGGYLLYRWKKLNDSAACISNGYCPEYTVFGLNLNNNGILQMKNNVCMKDGNICKGFFNQAPAFIQTFNTVGMGLFLQLMYGWQNKLQISMTVYKTT